MKQLLINALKDAYVPQSREVFLENKKCFLQNLHKMNEVQRERDIVAVLRGSIPTMSEIQKSIIKSRVMQYALVHHTKPSFADGLFDLGLSLSKKALAMTLSGLAIFSSFGSLSELPGKSLVQPALAGYMACSAGVLLNSLPCDPSKVIAVKLGDQIDTPSGGEATIVYTNNSLVRVDSTSRAALDTVNNGQIHLEQGAVWVHSPSDLGQAGSIRVSTPSLKMKVQQGAAGLAFNGSTTQLLSMTAAVEVQIDHHAGTTELVNLAPAKKLVVKQMKARTQVRESALDAKSSRWAVRNRAKDVQYIASPHQVPISTTQLLLQAHENVLQGKIVLAQQNLLELLELTTDNSGNDSDLAILNDIGQKSHRLQPLVESLKGRRVDQMRQLTSKDQQSRGPSVSGAARKSDEGSSRVLGEAVKDTAGDVL